MCFRLTFDELSGQGASLCSATRRSACSAIRHQRHHGDDCVGHLLTQHENVPQTTGPLVREAQRHLVQFVLQPIAEVVAQEASEQLEGEGRSRSCEPASSLRPRRRARAFATMIEGLSNAKAAGLTPAQVQAALTFIDEGAPTASP